MAIDLGTSRTRIWLDREGLVLDEASTLAVDQRRGKVIAVGDEALAMKGRVDQPVKIFEPIQQPKVTNDDQLLALLKAFLQQVNQEHYFFNPTIVTAVADKTSPAVKQVIAKTISNLGAKEALIVSQPLAAAIGVGVPIVDASGCFLIQLGAGVLEAAAISLGKIVQVESNDQAGQYLDQLIKGYFYQQHFLKISLSTAEKVKINLGTVDEKVNYQMTVAGQNWQRSSPQEMEISAGQIRDIIHEYAVEVEQLIKSLLASVPPDLTTDAVDKGLLLSGGLAQLDGLDQTLTQSLNLPVSVVDEPDLAVVRGLGTIVGHLDEFKQSLGYQLD